MARLRVSPRMLLVQTAVLLCIVLAGVLVRRQSVMLPDAVSVPRSTPAPDRANVPVSAGPTATPGAAVTAPDGPTTLLIDDDRFFYTDG